MSQNPREIMKRVSLARISGGGRAMKDLICVSRSGRSVMGVLFGSRLLGEFRSEASWMVFETMAPFGGCAG